MNHKSFTTNCWGGLVLMDVIIIKDPTFHNLSTLMELLRFPTPPAPALHHWSRHPAPMIERVQFHAAWASMFNASLGFTNIIMLHHACKNEMGINFFLVN